MAIWMGQWLQGSLQVPRVSVSPGTEPIPAEPSLCQSGNSIFPVSFIFCTIIVYIWLRDFFLYLFFNDKGRNASIPSMFPFLALSCCDLLDAAKQRSLAGKPKAGRWADGNGGWDLSERRRSCLGAAHTLRVLATFWFEKGLQPLNYWELRGNRL